MICVIHSGQAVFFRQPKKQGNVFPQDGLVFLDWQEVGYSLVDNLLNNLGLFADSINRNDTTSRFVSQ